MKACPNYLKIVMYLEDKKIYKIESPDISIGVFNEEKNGFIGLKNGACTDLTFVSMDDILKSQETHCFHVKASLLGELPLDINMCDENEKLFIYLLENYEH